MLWKRVCRTHYARLESLIIVLHSHLLHRRSMIIMLLVTSKNTSFWKVISISVRCQASWIFNRQAPAPGRATGARPGWVTERLTALSTGQWLVLTATVESCQFYGGPREATRIMTALRRRRADDFMTTDAVNQLKRRPGQWRGAYYTWQLASCYSRCHKSPVNASVIGRSARW